MDCRKLLIKAIDAGFGFIVPFVPNIMTDFFASQHSGSTMHCGGWSSSHRPPEACIVGSETSVTWSAYQSFLSNFVLAFLFSPMTGVWSDLIGRKPFLLIGQALSLAPYLILAGNQFFNVSLYFYYPAEALSGVVSTFVAILACVADLIPRRFRAIGFAWTTGVFAITIAVTPALGILMHVRTAILAGVVCKVLGLMYTAVRPEVLLSGSLLKGAQAVWPG
jgi:MFS family permease